MDAEAAGPHDLHRAISEDRPASHAHLVVGNLIARSRFAALELDDAPESRRESHSEGESARLVQQARPRQIVAIVRDPDVGQCRPHGVGDAIERETECAPNEAAGAVTANDIASAEHLRSIALSHVQRDQLRAGIEPHHLGAVPNLAGAGLAYRIEEQALRLPLFQEQKSGPVCFVGELGEVQREHRAFAAAR